MRMGDWMQTFSGRPFWPLDPRADEVFIDDIAHALSMQCRYAGHCLRFYSVAEHSVLLSRALGEGPEGRWALLHDAAEAYLVDLPRPVKHNVIGYREAEAVVMAAVCQRFGLPLEMPERVNEWDGRIIGDERVNLSVSQLEWTTRHEPLGVKLCHWSPVQAENAFHMRFERLFPEHAL